jgi:rare lipoprotein A
MEIVSWCSPKRMCATTRLHRTLLFALAAILVACSAAPPQRITQTPAPRPGAYYQDDGPPPTPPEVFLNAPDAQPRSEPLHRFANRPYVVLSKEYVPMTSLAPLREQGVASWYGRKFHGQKTATGELYDLYAMTAAHPTAPLPSYARVTNLENRRSVIVRINDRGPFLHNRIIDLSYAAAAKLGYAAKGSARVEVELLVPGSVSVLTPVPLPAPAQEKPPIDTVQRSGTGFFVQLGVFSNSANAERLVNQLAPIVSETMGPKPTIANEGERYRVRVGPYPTRADAQAALENIYERAGVRGAIGQ